MALSDAEGHLRHFTDFWVQHLVKLVVLTENTHFCFLQNS